MLPHHLSLKNGRSAIVRTATARDADAWIDTVNSIAAEDVYLMTEQFARPVEDLRRLFNDARPSSSVWMVGEVDGSVVAGADVRRGEHRKNAHTANFGVFVRREFRGLGLGGALLQAGIDWARSVGILKIKLGVFSTNERAIALYHKFGFEEEARLRGEVVLSGRPVDEILMALWLPGSGPATVDPGR
ncbi:MAG TPA: GNAT family N-acetyltransferase [Thermoplasmata archaeon]|nr:GNAT family N-acetyltransferase [Thermoplasmata archaeon]